MAVQSHGGVQKGAGGWGDSEAPFDIRHPDFVIPIHEPS